MTNAISNLLDIFIITYNRANKLNKTLEQVLSQNSPIKDFEITIIDNNSTDHTKEIVEIAKQLKQIRTWLDIPFPQGNAHFSDLTNAFSDMSFQMGTRDLDLLCYDKGTDIPMPF